MVLFAARTINRTLVYLWLLMTSMVKFQETKELVGARQPQGQSERETAAP
jgi:hypothetical protein